MTSFHEAAPRPDLTPENVLGDLCLWASMKLVDAWERNRPELGVEWVTRGAVTDPQGDRTPVLWYRLGETAQITDANQERFDVGMEVDSRQRRDERPQVVLDHGFSVRKLRPEGALIGRVDLATVLRYAGVVPPDSETLVTDLQTKLHNYKLQPIKVREEPQSPAA